MSSWAARIDALYEGDPAQFVAARDALAKQAREGGEKATASAIKELRRPSLGAWYANVAARAGLVSLREWLDLGATLRAAQARLDLRAVADLGARRAHVEGRVIADLTAHLAALGVTARPAGLDEFRGTLRAALADASASEALSQGRLQRSLSYAGFGEVDVSAAVSAWAASSSVTRAAPSIPADPGPEATPQGDAATIPTVSEAQRSAQERRDRARDTLSAAEEHVSDARSAEEAALWERSVASTAVEEAERTVRAAQKRLASAAATLGAATRSLDAAQASHRAAREARTHAQADLRAAERTLEEAS